MLTSHTAGPRLRLRYPPESASFRPGPGADVTRSTCLTCHSADYVAIQAPEPHDFWKEEVNKMIKNYGATIPEDRIEPIADYITRTYGIEAIGAATAPKP